MRQSFLPPEKVKELFLDSQDAEALVLSGGLPSSDLQVLVECLARCGDAKYGTVPEMDLPARVRGFVTNVLGEADALETITEVWDAKQLSKAQLGNLLGTRVSEAGSVASRQQQASARGWEYCWDRVKTNDLPGYPPPAEPEHVLH